MRPPSWAAHAAHALYRERVSRIYLWAVGVVLLLVLLDSALFSHRTASPVGLLLIVLTLPWTPLLWSLFAAVGGMDTRTTAYGWSGWALALLAAVVSAAVNAVLLGYAARVLRRRGMAAR